MTLPVLPQDVRDFLQLSADGSSVYADSMLYSHILAAIGTLETATHRYIADHDFTTTPWAGTSMLAAQVPIPGFRTFVTASWGGAAITVGLPGDGNASPSAWAIPDVKQSGVYTALQFRAWRADSDRWWLSDSAWFDKAMDSPFHPGNRGGGFAWTSMPNDLLIYGHAGWPDTAWPGEAILAVKELAGYYTLQPRSLLSTIANTPGGSPRHYADMPGTVRDFIGAYTVGQQAVSVG